MKRSEALEIIDRTNEAVGRWPEIARECGCPTQQANLVQRGHRFLRAAGP